LLHTFYFSSPSLPAKGEEEKEGERELEKKTKRGKERSEDGARSAHHFPSSLRLDKIAGGRGKKKKKKGRTRIRKRRELKKKKKRGRNEELLFTLTSPLNFNSLKAGGKEGKKKKRKIGLRRKVERGREKKETLANLPRLSPLSGTLAKREGGRKVDKGKKKEEKGKGGGTGAVSSHLKLTNSCHNQSKKRGKGGKRKSQKKREKKVGKTRFKSFFPSLPFPRGRDKESKGNGTFKEKEMEGRKRKKLNSR